ncbi:MAG: enoyl-CoA hydratase, partial [Gammaproteobacteria bacterium]
MMENVTFDELELRQSAELTRTLTHRDIELFAAVSGDVNPAHMDEIYALNGAFHGVIGHGMWSGGLISTVLGTMLPGPGTIYLGQEMRFLHPVRIGDAVTVTVSVKSKHPDKPIVIFDCICRNQNGETVLAGTATVLAPTEKIRVARPDLPQVDILERNHFNGIMASAHALGKIRVAVVHPVGENVIEAVKEAVDEQM